jgi:hypothetical protein
VKDTLTYSGSLVIRRCWCGIRHAIPSELDYALDHDRNQGAYCPLGHSYVSTTHERRDADRLREQLEGARNESARQREHRQAAERRVVAMKGVVTKTKKRIAAGRCVRCTQEFPDLATHMAEAHPDYAPEADT